MVRTTVTLLTLFTISACTVSSSDNRPDFTPTVSAADVDRAFAEADARSALPRTTFGNLPTGSVTYTGKLGADVSGDANGSILGDLNMNVGFASNRVGGNVTNINLIDPDGTPNQRFDGRLALDGVETAGQIDSFASGDISGVDVNGNRVDAQMLLILEGDVRDRFSRGDTVYGTASGQTEGDFEMDVEGVFYGTRD